MNKNRAPFPLLGWFSWLKRVDDSRKVPGSSSCRDKSFTTCSKNAEQSFSCQTTCLDGEPQKVTKKGRKSEFSEYCTAMQKRSFLLNEYQCCGQYEELYSIRFRMIDAAVGVPANAALL
uniref:Uncharacterized protein n=1 Tax=Romanomermis culicivorax TaxID=13658 RepID=A0A915JGM1_ROMCU